MELVMFGLFVFMMTPVALLAWYYAVHKPKRGRAMQDRVWQPLAARLGAKWTPATSGVARFHAFGVPYGSTIVTAIVFHRAAFDPALHLVRYGDNTWRTFVQASVVGGSGPAVIISPGRGTLPIGDAAFQAQHATKLMLATPAEVVAARLTPPVLHAFGVLGRSYELVAGPSFVSLELPGICSDPALLEAAVHVVGGFAQPYYRR